ncbi:MAG: sulfatase [Phycisphaerae bacterium]|jgi:arylsulfatase A-like enzyme
MRRPLWGILIVAGIAVGGGVVWRLARPSAPKAVFLIVVDTLRADRLSCYGYESIETPQIDRLASMGVRFARAHSVASWTTPSMGAILTSRYPTQLGLIEAPAPDGKQFKVREKRAQRAYTIPSDVPTLAETMRGAGYHTAAFVDQPMLNIGNGFVKGVSEWYCPIGEETVGRYDPNAFEPARRWSNMRGAEVFDPALVAEFDNWLKKKAHTTPFVWIHLLTPHRPYRPPPRYMPPEPRTKPARYDGEVQTVDEMVGSILDSIERYVGLGESTIVFASDHGEEFGEHGSEEHGHSLHREVLHVPLIIASPGLPAGHVVDALVPTIDIMPTIIELAEASESAPTSMEGTSLIPTVRGQDTHRTIFSEGMLYGTTERSFVEGGFKLMYDIQIAQPKLFNILSDPDELVDLASERPQLRDAMRSSLWNMHNRFRNEYLDRYRFGTTSPAETAEDPQVLDALRALGYVGD